MCVFSFLSLKANSDIPYNEAWNQFVYFNKCEVNPNYCKVLSNGNLVVIGISKNRQSSIPYLFLAKINSNGELLSSKIDSLTSIPYLVSLENDIISIYSVAVNKLWGENTYTPAFSKYDTDLNRIFILKNQDSCKKYIKKLILNSDSSVRGFTNITDKDNIVYNFSKSLNLTSIDTLKIIEADEANPLWRLSDFKIIQTSDKFNSGVQIDNKVRIFNSVDSLVFEYIAEDYAFAYLLIKNSSGENLLFLRKQNGEFEIVSIGDDYQIKKIQTVSNPYSMPVHHVLETDRYYLVMGATKQINHPVYYDKVIEVYDKDFNYIASQIDNSELMDVYMGFEKIDSSNIVLLSRKGDSAQITKLILKSSDVYEECDNLYNFNFNPHNLLLSIKSNSNEIIGNDIQILGIDSKQYMFDYILNSELEIELKLKLNIQGIYFINFKIGKQYKTNKIIYLL